MTDLTTVLAESSYTGLDQVVYDLMQEIRRMGHRVERAIIDYQEIAQTAQESVSTGERPLGGIHTPDNPVQLLRDVEPLCEMARKLGVPEKAITSSRAGRFVAHRDYLTSTQEPTLGIDLQTDNRRSRHNRGK